MTDEMYLKMAAPCLRGAHLLIIRSIQWGLSEDYTVTLRNLINQTFADLEVQRGPIKYISWSVRFGLEKD